jgi:uncharacterized membrane protein YqaE (UPF0057 family)
MATQNIDANQWTLYDKIWFGGLGYGSFCLPSDFFKTIVAILFPPLGQLINIIEDTIIDSFPYITWDTVKILCTYNSLNTIIYSFILTTLFYVPGLVYVLTNIVDKERKTSYDVSGTTIYQGYDQYGYPITYTETTINGNIYINRNADNDSKTVLKYLNSILTDQDRANIELIKNGGDKGLEKITNIGSSIVSSIADINWKKSYDWGAGITSVNWDASVSWLP